MLAWISDQTLLTINTIELAGIVYLAIAVSMLRERISRIEGRDEGKEKQAELNHLDK